MFAPTIATFLGAFLLFEVQLIVAKYLLPWYGGTPAVWTSCMVFFQVALLAGYAYAHVLARRARPRVQRAVHLGLLGAGGVALLAQAFLWGTPLLPDAAWKPSGNGHPATGIAVLLLAAVGLPFLVLAATSPLLQSWTARTYPDRSPYRLYALSNLGALLGLLAYPFVVEPALTIRGQAWTWALAYVVYAGCCGAAADRQAHAAVGSFAPAPPLPSGPRPRIESVALWVALPCASTVMLLAVTNQICQEIAVVPLLWVLPLAVYLISFVLCFEHERYYRRGLFQPLLGVAAAIACLLLYHGVDVPVPWQVGGFSFVLFACCMTCHGELARAKPQPRYLTAYFLLLAAGGALGGVLAGVVAPRVFRGYWELHAGLAACGVLVVLAVLRDRDSWLNRGRVWPAALLLLATAIGAAQLLRRGAVLGSEGLLPSSLGRFAVAVAVALLLLAWLERRRRTQRDGARRILGVACLALALSLLSLVLRAHIRAVESRAVTSLRDFFGVVSVEASAAEGDLGDAFYLRHGRVVHGFQLAAPPLRALPTSYFAEGSGISLALRYHPHRVGALSDPRPLRVGVVGLGIGTLAAYGRDGDLLRFYEISPAVIEVASGPKSVFTYLADTRARVEIVPGDGRVSLERELASRPKWRFDVLVMDAFSSGAVPLHLLTREAFATYLARLDPQDGILAVNISNRNVDLRGVVARLAAEFGLTAVSVEAARSPDGVRWPSLWALLTRNHAFLALPQVTATARPLVAGVSAPLWTDDHSSLLAVINW
ncbi:MAG: spermidine synthase [Thermoanaerobaculales bacterium]